MKHMTYTHGLIAGFDDNGLYEASSVDSGRHVVLVTTYAGQDQYNMMRG